ncbi:MAG: DNA polymerase III subunit delta [Burkholderiaceae bacterium]|jgi:DNA polymerase-3 subunit delta|nr:DNA polymerase III subunit delta [Burkholderiaceae bacterium]
MRVPADALDAHLAQAKPLRALYLLHGDEMLLQQEAADAIRAAARTQGFDARCVYTVAGAHFDWSAVLAGGGSLNLFAARQIIEVRIPTGKPGKEGAAALQKIAANVARDPDTLWLVSLPRPDKAARESVWFKALETAGASVPIENIERSRLPDWIARRLARQNQRVRPGPEGQSTLQFFADRVEGNLLAAHQEIQKLALLYPGGELSWQQVEAAVNNVARYDVFQLGAAALAGDTRRVVRILDGLRAEDESPVLVHTILAEEVRALKRVKDALGAGSPLPLALRDNRVWGPRERAFERVLPRLKPARLADLLERAHIADGIVKGLRRPDWPADPWLALGALAQALCWCCRTG